MEEDLGVYVVVQFYLFKLIIIHYHTQKQRGIKFKPRTKLNHNIDRDVLLKVWTKPYSATI